MHGTVTVVIPAYNAAQFLGDCLRALASQNIPPSQFDIIVVDDGSTDNTAAVAQGFGAQVVRQPHKGEGPARNAGIQVATGEWIANTDADCLPSRGWLQNLLKAAAPGPQGPALGAAGRILGYTSASPVSRMVDLTGGIDTERHLAHPTFPYAPLGNVLYRRDALAAVGGLDERYQHYPGPDLHRRLQQIWPGKFVFEPRALVLHRHPATWGHYWRQQQSYGVGYAQFLIHHRQEIPWPVIQELRAWGEVVRLAATAALPGEQDQKLVRRGLAVKALAQRLGFMRTYWDPAERQKWA